MNNNVSDIIKSSSGQRLELLRLPLTSHLSQLHRSSRHVHTVLFPEPAIQLSASFDQHDLWTTEKSGHFGRFRWVYDNVEYTKLK